MFDFSISDQLFHALPSGGLWLPDVATLVAADLHLGKGQSYAIQGSLLPPYDDRATLRQLAADIEQYQPRRVWLLGDSFHRTDSPDQIDAEIWKQLRQLAAGREWVWVTGNHDAASFTGERQNIPGEVCDQVEESGTLYSHQPEATDRMNVFGHYHPKVRVQLQGRRLSGKCFIVAERQLLCPAYGAYTGGLWWPEVPLGNMFHQPRFLLCYKNRVTEVREQSLVTR